MSNLMAANQQWRQRPADERFETLLGLKTAVLDRRNISHEGDVKIKDLRVIPGGNNDIVMTMGDAPVPLELTHWGFGQLCQMAKAPASYIRSLTPELASANLNYSLPMAKEDAKVLLAYNGKAEARAFTSTTYGRIWDIDVVNAVERITDRNPSWHNPPAYSVKEAVNRSVIVNSGLYASDRDVWMFFVDEDHKIEINGEFLSRGFFVWNSEVGKTSFGITTFMYRYVCNNHIVWGAHDVKDIRIRHSANAPARAFHDIMPKLKNYIESSVITETATIQKAIEYYPGGLTKDGMVDWLTNKGFTRNVSENAYAYAVREEGDGSSLWNIVQGLTAMARDKAHIDDRVGIERQAGRLLELARV